MKVRANDNVNQPYARVRDAILANPHYVFRHATAGSATHSARLHVRIGLIDVGTDVTIRVAGVAQDSAYDVPATKVELAWEAASRPGMFPSLTGTLLIYAQSPTETQLDLDGSYEPPLGKVGELVDAAVGHRLAEVAVSTFVAEVAAWLREELASPAPAPPVEAPESVPADTEC